MIRGRKRASGVSRAWRGVAAAMLLLAVACGPSGEGGAVGGHGGAGDDLAPDVARARAAGLFSLGRFEQAAAFMAPLVDGLVDGDDVAGEDLVRAAAIAAANADPMDPLAHIARARALLDRAEAKVPDDPQIPYLRGHLFMDDLEYEAAAAAYERVLELAPGDGETRYLLAEVYEQLGRTADAEALLLAIRERGVEYGGSVYATATFMLSRIYIRQSREDPDMFARGEALLAERDLLEAQDIKSIDTTTMRRSNLGAVQPPSPPGAGGAVTSSPAPEFEAGETIAERALFSGQSIVIGPDEQTALLVSVPARPSDGRPKVTLGLMSFGSDGGLVPHEMDPLDTPPGRLLAAGDIDDSTAPEEGSAGLHHPAQELLFHDVQAKALRLLTLADDGRSWLEIAHGIDTPEMHTATFADYDHDGDLDVIVGARSGLHFWRNDGATDRLARRFESVPRSWQMGIGTVSHIIAEDFDSDQDVDFLTLDAQDHKLHLLSNLRGGTFEDRTFAAGLTSIGNVRDVDVQDIDEDGRPDLVLHKQDDDYVDDSGPYHGPTHPAPIEVKWYRNLHQRFSPAGGLPIEGAFLSHLLDTLRFADIDNDGHVDVIYASAQRDSDTKDIMLLQGPLHAEGLEPRLLATMPGASYGIAVADVDGDQRSDIVTNAAERRPDESVSWSLQVLTNTGPTGNGMRYVLRGRKDNTHGVGAIVEARVGDAYRRIYWDGSPQVLGCGDEDAPDYVIVTWPNGVVQYDPHIDTKDNDPFTQPEGAAGSCPFLYTWNGETYEFIYDVLGATPLGLPMAPGRMVPFNHHEYSKIEGPKLVPDEDGRLKLVLTEELREVTYLDRARLEAVDHPIGTEVQPNEAFRLPPFPEHHLHTLTDVVPVPRVIFRERGREGRGPETHGPGIDVTPLTAKLDELEARQWTPLPSQFPGIAEPWSLELVLAETPEQRAALAAAPRIRLMLTGWLQWAEASTNMALAHHPVHRFELPSLSVPDASAPGGWRLIEPPIGFPAGKTRTQVVDITDLVDPDDPRLLFTTTQRLSWDRIALALDDDDAPVVRTAMEPVASRVTFRGFSKRLFDTGPLPDGDFGVAGDTGTDADRVATAQERFDWDERDMPRWNQHPGLYTRYGEVTPLLTATDDMYVIFGAGDAVFVEFDGSALPPVPEGWTRDWLLYLDGWAKDRDPNTIAAEEVEPLPFHGMSSYPPPAGEAYPDTPEHRAYRAEWNTRPGRQLIVPLSARR